jgi:hypothetical protein
MMERLPAQLAARLVVLCMSHELHVLISQQLCLDCLQEEQSDPVLTDSAKPPDPPTSMAAASQAGEAASATADGSIPEADGSCPLPSTTE